MTTQQAIDEEIHEVDQNTLYGMLRHELQVRTEDGLGKSELGSFSEDLVKGEQSLFHYMLAIHS